MSARKQCHFAKKPVSLSIQVAETLTQAILMGTFKGGDQLVEADLQEQFEISRSPLREAFRELEKKGLVEIIPRRGTFIKTISKKDIEEHFPVRAKLEGLAAAMAAARMSSSILNQLTDILTRMENAVTKGDTNAYYHHHLQFHDLFIKTSGNSLLIHLLENLRTQSVWHRFSYQYYQENLFKAFTVHRRILGLFAEEKPDPEAIEKVVSYHIDIALDRFIAYLEERDKS